ncbi:hypothetical protein D9M73_193370 [compost metagenome]
MRTGFVVRALGAAIRREHAVAVMQGGGVVEQRYPGIGLPFAVPPPFLQDLAIAPDGRAIETDQRPLQGIGIDRRRWQRPLTAHLIDKAFELAGVVEHDFAGEAQLAQVIEQKTLLGHGAVQLGVG